MRALALAIALVLAAGCGNRDDEGATAPPRAADDAAPTDDAAPAVRELTDASGLDAWRAVIERASLLARRGDEGTVVGRLGGADGDYRWLIDESEGDGALAIRVALPDYAAQLPAGARVQLDGAWAVDAQRRWVWRVRAVGRVTGAPPPQLEREPGHAIETIDAAPDDARTPDQVGRGGQMAFAVVAAPVRHGDGWAIAAEPGVEQDAWLVLPGEHPIYGGQDLLAPDERWPLEPGRRYVVAVRRVRGPRGGRLRVVYAAAPPQALP